MTPTFEYSITNSIFVSLFAIFVICLSQSAVNAGIVLAVMKRPLSALEAYEFAIRAFAHDPSITDMARKKYWTLLEVVTFEAVENKQFASCAI